MLNWLAGERIAEADMSDFLAQYGEVNQHCEASDQVSICDNIYCVL